MGGGGDPEDLQWCSGHDVLQALHDVFGHPNSKAYQDAKDASLDLFQGVPYGPDNWQDLYAAYQAAYGAVGIPLCQNWQPYLQTLSPDDIYIIAQARYQGLVLGLAMSTLTHKPTQGRYVKVSTGGGSITIDSPYSPVVIDRNRNRNP
jgi:hypothetical protein